MLVVRASSSNQRAAKAMPLNNSFGIAATWIFCGDKSWRRRGRDTDRDAAAATQIETPRPRHR